MPDEQPIAVLVTCEHAGNEVPRQWTHLFRRHESVLRTHRGYDIGALGVARELASRLRTTPIVHLTTRLLVEVNRSPDHPQVFSEFTRDLLESDRRAIMESHYSPHRSTIERAIARLIARGCRVLHAGAHSFTPVLGDEVREVQIGLLFDPARSFESAICDTWCDALRLADPSLDVRFNEPYKGIDDGLTTWLRTRFTDEFYAGIEIEVRNDLITRGPNQRRFGAMLAATVPTGHAASA